MRSPRPCVVPVLAILAALSLVGPVSGQEPPRMEIHVDGIGDLLWGESPDRAKELFAGGSLVSNVKLRVRLGYRSSDTYYADQIYRLKGDYSLFFFRGKFAGVYHSVPGPDDLDLAEQERLVRDTLSDDGALDIGPLVVRVLRGQRRAFQKRHTAVLVGHNDTLEAAAAEFFRREEQAKRGEANKMTLKLLGRWDEPDQASNEEKQKSGSKEPETGGPEVPAK